MKYIITNSFLLYDYCKISDVSNSSLDGAEITWKLALLLPVNWLRDVNPEYNPLRGHNSTFFRGHEMKSNVKMTPKMTLLKFQHGSFEPIKFSSEVSRKSIDFFSRLQLGQNHHVVSYHSYGSQTAGSIKDATIILKKSVDFLNKFRAKFNSIFIFLTISFSRTYIFVFVLIKNIIY